MFELSFAAFALFGHFCSGRYSDKTQLATISLAAEYQNPASVLIGTTIGMLVADGVDIVGACFYAGGFRCVRLSFFQL